jgi:hypothetical protein
MQSSAAARYRAPIPGLGYAATRLCSWTRQGVMGLKIMATPFMQ